uniref:Biogenesis of lysosome-related organelles complex 1 subunit 7 n=1 Tax=Hyaloperonospora arabidopsidis (strain Emoy2) TaxID=559515 RepID=M4BTL3_HYAAE
MATTEDVSFAQGMFVTLWPKVERCHDYIEILLSAQEKLQHTVDQLIAGLQEAEKAEKCSIQRYADRLRNFPARVEGLEKKLLTIKARLVAMKKSQSHGVRTTTKLSTEESAFYTTAPLF